MKGNQWLIVPLIRPYFLGGNVALGDLGTLRFPVPYGGKKAVGFPSAIFQIVQLPCQEALTSSGNAASKPAGPRPRPRPRPRDMMSGVSRLFQTETARKAGKQNRDSV